MTPGSVTERDAPCLFRHAVRTAEFRRVSKSMYSIVVSPLNVLEADHMDEVHCIKQWAIDSTFQKEYSCLNNLRSLVPRNPPVRATSATLTNVALRDVHE